MQSAASAIVSRDAAKAEAEAKVVVAAGYHANRLAREHSRRRPSAVSDINARLARAGQLRPGQPLDNKGPDAGSVPRHVGNQRLPAKRRDGPSRTGPTSPRFWKRREPPSQRKEHSMLRARSLHQAPSRSYTFLLRATRSGRGNALSELTRLLKEGTLAAADAENRAPASGRYTIT